MKTAYYPADINGNPTCAYDIIDDSSQDWDIECGECVGGVIFCEPNRFEVYHEWTLGL